MRHRPLKAVLVALVMTIGVVGFPDPALAHRGHSHCANKNLNDGYVRICVGWPAWGSATQDQPYAIGYNNTTKAIIQVSIVLYAKTNEYDFWARWPDTGGTGTIRAYDTSGLVRNRQRYGGVTMCAAFGISGARYVTVCNDG